MKGFGGSSFMTWLQRIVCTAEISFYAPSFARWSVRSTCDFVAEGTMQIRSERAATMCGLVAILLWSTAAGLIRGVSEQFGPLGGAAMICNMSRISCIELPPRMQR